MDRRFVAFLAVILIGFGAFVFVNNQKKDSINANIKPSNHVTGKLDSSVTLLEYGDFQCPACAGFEPALKEVRNTYGDHVKFQFRQLPISQIHPNAMAAARTAEAAAKQGKFWEMHDLLYTQANWSAWTEAQDPTSLFNSYARQLSLDETRFKADFRSATVNDTIAADRREFDKLKIQVSTPTFFLNGKKIENGQMTEVVGGQSVPSAKNIGKLLDAELK